MINDSDGQQVMVLFIVPGSELRSLLGTTGLPPAETPGPRGNGTNGREYKAAPQ